LTCSFALKLGHHGVVDVERGLYRANHTRLRLQNHPHSRMRLAMFTYWKILFMAYDHGHDWSGMFSSKNGKPLAELIPHRVPKRSPLGIWKDKVTIKGDIISPIDVEWNALK
jgi:hypothetical protein